MLKSKSTKKSKSKLTPQIISFFKKELREAGGFDELMLIKNAIERIEGKTYIITHENIKEYKNKYLTGKYRTLRPLFNTKVPYAFWSQLYVALKRSISPSK